MHHIPRSLILHTERCTLHFPGLDLAPHVLAFVTHADFPPLLPWASATTPELVRGRLARAHSAWDAGRQFCFGITLKRTGAFLGLATLSTDPGSRSWSLAYLIDPGQWGNGYATEGARRLAEFAFAELDAVHLWIGVPGWNPASARIATKLGMNQFRSTPRAYSIDGQWIPTEDYQITLSDWNVRSKSLA